jgi:hypothetical protein
MGNFSERFQQANKAYLEKDYEEARDSYLSLTSRDHPVGVVEYNLGNCYFRLGDLGRAVLHYERATRLRPRDADLLHNLRLARRYGEDPPLPESPNAIVRFLERLRGHLTVNEWTVCGSLLLLLGLSLLILRCFVKGGFWRRALRNGSIITIFAFFWAAANAATLGSHYSKPVAVVVEREIAVHSEPSADSEERFRLHAGSLVEILHIHGSPRVPEGAPDRGQDIWLRVRRAPGLQGYTRQSGLEPI